MINSVSCTLFIKKLGRITAADICFYQRMKCYMTDLKEMLWISCAHQDDSLQLSGLLAWLPVTRLGQWLRLGMASCTYRSSALRLHYRKRVRCLMKLMPLKDYGPERLTRDTDILSTSIATRLGVQIHNSYNAFWRDFHNSCLYPVLLFPYDL